jgi:RNA polymerase sigma factor (sigma-70 family)
MAEVKTLPDDETWKSIIPKLFYYAIWQTRRKKLPQEEAKDLVEEAITRLLTGGRKWDQEKVDLLTYLKGVIRDLSRRKVKSADKTRRYNEVRDVDGESLDFVESAKSSEPTPLEELERKELEEYIWSEAGDDEEMQWVLICIFEGKRRQDIANELNFPVSKVDNIMKRVRRAAKKFLNQTN